MKHSRKAFYFDLDEEKLKATYPSDSETGYKRAWSDIRSFLEDNGFEHTQYSGYETINGISYYEAYVIFENLQAELPWFKDCAQVATVTEIGERHNVLDHLSKSVAIEEPIPDERQHLSLQEELSDIRRALQALEENKDTLELPHRNGHSTIR